MNARSARRLPWLVAGAAALAWAPVLLTPLSSDEGGYLLVASQWHPGTSLYGRYWVDRPPLLITIFDLATHAGGSVGLRMIGIAAVVTSVLLAGHLTRIALGRQAVTPILVAGVFLTTPLFGATMVDGELLAVPLVLAGIVALVRAGTACGPRQYAWAAGAGVAAAASALVKQNVIDVFVVAAVLMIHEMRSAPRNQVTGRTLAFVAGAGLATGLCLAWAALQGTDTMSLWDAVVTFRGQAAGVIEGSSSQRTSARFIHLLLAALLSGGPVVVGVLAIRLRRTIAASPHHDLRASAIALLAWEVVGVAAGGSYWLHYLLGLVPGMVLLAVAALQRPPTLRRATAAALVLATGSTLVCAATSAVTTRGGTSETEVAAYLHDHSRAGDSVVVGFGHPDIVWDAGLRSPYQELWSLPVRVRDPQLQQLTDILSGGQAPTWVVVAGTSLATWGVDATAAQRVLEQRYRSGPAIGPFVVWRRDRAPTTRSTTQSAIR